MAIKTIKGPRGTAYQADIWINGKRVRKHFERKADAVVWLDENRVKRRHGEYDVSDWTFETAAHQYLASRANHRPRYYTSIRGNLFEHLIPALGPMRLDTITALKIEELRNTLREKGLKRASVATYLRTCGAVFKYAVRTGHAVRNPVSQIERDSQHSQELDPDAASPIGVRALSLGSVPGPDEIKKIIRSYDGLHRTGCLAEMSTMLSFAFYTGVREGEMLGLRWSDVDPDYGAIHINRSVSFAKGTEAKSRAKFFAPKTESGIRRIPLPKACQALLKDWHKRTLYHSPDSLVWPDVMGDVMKAGLLGRRLRESGYRVKFHGFRHAYASNLIANGATVTEVQHLLGHKDPGVTLAVYLHFFEQATKTASKAVDALGSVLA